MRRSLVILALIVTAAGCSNLEPFTEGLRQQYRIDDDAALKLQYYVDGDIVLEREVTTPSVEVKHGKIVSRAGKYINQIAVEHLTPGVAVVASASRLEVSFDATSTSTLVFLLDDRSADSPGFYHFDKREGATQSYDGQQYTVGANRAQRTPFLRVDLDKLTALEKTRKTLPGRELK
jgi:hypothetical protein